MEELTQMAKHPKELKSIYANNIVYQKYDPFSYELHVWECLFKRHHLGNHVIKPPQKYREKKE